MPNKRGVRQPVLIVVLVGVILAIMPKQRLIAQSAPVPDFISAGTKAAGTDCLFASRNAVTAGDVVRVQYGKTTVEKLTGAAARNHLLNLLARRPQAFAAAREEFQRSGWKETDYVYVERTLASAEGDGRAPGSDVVLAAVSESNNQGEIVIWSADDGNNATWEGSIYFEVYSTGAASTWDGQIDVSTTEHPWLWYRKTWEKQPRPRQVSNEGILGASHGFELAVQRGPEQLSPGSQLADFYGWAQCWRACVVGGCTTAAVACRLSGPLWAGCFAAWCVGVEVGCGVTCYFAT